MRLFGETYALLHRRHLQAPAVTPEGRGLLLHMAWAGPMSIGELALHTDRAQSVVSETVDVLESHELVARVRDPRDRRRTLVWLTDRARTWIADEQEPLDRERIEAVLLAMDPSHRERLLDCFEQFIASAEQLRKQSVETACDASNAAERDEDAHDETVRIDPNRANQRGKKL